VVLPKHTSLAEATGRESASNSAMAINIQAVEYFYTRVENESGNAYELLAQLASEDINLLAFSAVPFGPDHVELTIFPEMSRNFQALAARSGWMVTGPQHAILIQGDDRLGVLAEIHRKLDEAGVRVYASSGVTDGQGRYGYVIYTREADHQSAVNALF
jgi:hypothetical protein